MADKHISETHYLSLKEMVKSYAQSKWLYINRAFGCDCYHRVIDGDTDAGPAAGKETSKIGYLPGSPQRMGHYLCNVYRGQQRLLSQTHALGRSLDKCPVRLLLSGGEDTGLPDGDKN